MIYKWLKDRLAHKLKHLSWQDSKSLIKRHGPALVIIIVGWEIIEDVLFPLAFALLGRYVHPAFYGGIPVSWLLCLHWLTVPIIWGIWLKLTGKIMDKHNTHDSSCDHDH